MWLDYLVDLFFYKQIATTWLAYLVDLFFLQTERHYVTGLSG
jgi:hypothetical protein